MQPLKREPLDPLEVEKGAFGALCGAIESHLWESPWPFYDGKMMMARMALRAHMGDPEWEIYLGAGARGGGKEEG